MPDEIEVDPFTDIGPPPPPEISQRTIVRPKHHLQLRYEADQESFRRVPNAHHAAPLVFTFDSDSAPLIAKDEYFVGRDPSIATGHAWYGEMTGPWPSPKTLRVLWWEIVYANGDQWIAGGILSESTPPVGRLQGRGSAKLDDGQWNGFFPTSDAEYLPDLEIPDQCGAFFHWYTPKPWPHVAKVKWFYSHAPAGVESGLSFAPIEAPDFAGGQWDWNYDPQDRSTYTDKYGNNPYRGDGRGNPDIIAAIGNLPIRRIYPRQTHSHYITQQMSMHLARFLNDTKLGQHLKAREVLRALDENSQVQTGAYSPVKGPPHWINGRPQYLTVDAQGTQPTKGTRYQLTPIDAAALKPFILHEGRPEIGGKWQFTECFGRNAVDPHDRAQNEIQARASQYGGQYIHGANGHQEFEHGGWLVSDLASWLLAGDPLALRRIRHTAEGHVTVAQQNHSSRSTSGWRPNDEQLAGFALAYTTPEWHADAGRYIGDARAAAAWTQQNKLSETPYKALLTRGYEYIKPQPRAYVVDPAKGFDPSYQHILEGSFQLAIATLNFVQSARMEQGGAYFYNLYLSLVRYCVDCAMQPGIVDPDRGILDSYPVIGPDPTAPTVAQGLEWRAAPHQGRDWISDQGWLGPAMAAAALVLNDPKVIEFAKLIYLKQLARKVQGGQSFLSPHLGNIWSMHYEQAKAAARFGWPKG